MDLFKNLAILKASLQKSTCKPSMLQFNFKGRGFPQRDPGWEPQYSVSSEGKTQSPVFLMSSSSSLPYNASRVPPSLFLNAQTSLGQVLAPLGS